VFSQIVYFCKHFPAAVAAVSAVLGVFLWLAEPRIEEYITTRVQAESRGPCVTFPRSGHRATDTPPGAWAMIYWNDIEKHRDDCGQPHVIGVITNGDGLYHDSPLSVSGVIFPVGTFNMSYQFYIDPNVEQGNARFRVTVTYPDAVGGAPPAISPWVPFIILPEDHFENSP